MAHQSLYRRYRSQRFAELRGQDHVTSALTAAIESGRYGHAYLFSGPRGTGKTSTARILAKALNCESLKGAEPCCECSSCVDIENGRSLDLHELDAASHNKVDDIRDLISKVHLGSPGRTKVYILDEVHMLSTGAENALLKTLEEPPDHVVFVLATTEPHKVTATIRSRTQHLKFNLLPAEALSELVEFVATDAGLDLDSDALDYALQAGRGSARDTLSALDMVAVAGAAPAGSNIEIDLIKAVGERDTERAIAIIQEGLKAGQEPRVIAEATVEVLRNAFLAAMGASLTHLSDSAQNSANELASNLGPAVLTAAMEAIGMCLVEMRQAADPRVVLEVTVLRLCRSQTGTTVDDAQLAPLEARISQLENQVANLTQQLANAKSGTTTSTVSNGLSNNPINGADTAAAKGPIPKRIRPKKAVANSSATAAERTGTKPTETLTVQNLQTSEVVTALPTVWEAVSRKAKVRFSGGRVVTAEGSVITFALPNQIHRDRCHELKDEVAKAMTDHFRQPVTLELVVDTKPEPTSKNETEQSETYELGDEIGPIDQLEDATDVATSGLERLAQAFPGSEVIDT